jgi:hypothetical protein
MVRSPSHDLRAAEWLNANRRATLHRFRCLCRPITREHYRIGRTFYHTIDIARSKAHFVLAQVPASRCPRAGAASADRAADLLPRGTRARRPPIPRRQHTAAGNRLAVPPRSKPPVRWDPHSHAPVAVMVIREHGKHALRREVRRRTVRDLLMRARNRQANAADTVKLRAVVVWGWPRFGSIALFGYSTILA